MNTRRRNDPRRAILLITAMAAVLQLPLLFCGIDLADLGFYMTHYAQAYDHPASVEYNYMYYLTGIVGGGWLKLCGWPGIPGIVGMRLLGMLCNLGCVWMVSALSIRTWHDWRPAALSAALLICGGFILPVTFCYDLLTSLLTVGSLYLLLRSVGDDRKPESGYAFGSGLLMGVALFARVANAAGVLYVALYGVAWVVTRRRVWRQALIWSAGWCAGVAAVVLLMMVKGDGAIFVDNMTDLMAIAMGSGGETSHGMSNMLSAQISVWSRIIQVAVQGAFLVGLYVWVRRRNWSRVVFALCMLPVAALGVMLVMRTHITLLLSAVVLLGCVCVLALAGRDEPRLRLFAAAGLAIMIVMPLGSDGGIMNNGVAALWMGMPPAMAYFSNAGHIRRIHGWKLTAGRLSALMFTLLVCLICCRRMMTGGVYFDSTHLRDMTGSIDAPEAKYIRTSPERARIINDILKGVRHHVSPGDTLMVYGCGTTINYLTGTLPYIGCSWPEQLSEQALSRRLNGSQGHPAVLVLNFSTYGGTFGKPSVAYAMGADANSYHTPAKSAIVSSWLARHQYRARVITPYYTLYE